MMNNIVCLKFGDKYGPEFVNRLYWATKRNTRVPFTFHCFTEDPRGIVKDIQVHHLPHKLPGVGWWHKLYLFSEEVEIEGRIFYMDLDTLVTGNIDHLVTYDKGFACLRDLFLERQPNRKDKFGTGKEAIGSAVMSWEAGKHTQIWDTFIENPEAAVKSLHPHGDQKWVQKHQKERVYWQDICPNQIVSFKVSCRTGLPKGVRIICYHGKPSIPESINKHTNVQGYQIAPQKWVADHWRDEQTSKN